MGDGEPAAASQLITPPSLDRKVLTAALGITVLERTSDPQSDSAWLVRVNTVAFAWPELNGSDGSVVHLSELSPGMVITLWAHVELETGREYFVLTTQARHGPGNLTEIAYAVYTWTDMRQLTDITPSVGEIVSGGVPTPDEAREALVALVQETWAYREALRLGTPSVPIGEHLARALGAGAEATDSKPPGEPVDELLGRSIADYLALDGADRQLLAFVELPAEVQESLHLVPFRALVLFSGSEVDRYWALGFRTDTGTIGPYTILGSNEPFVEIFGSVAASETVALVGWPGPVIDPTVKLASSEGLAPELFGALVAPNGSSVLVLDLASGSVAYVTNAEADSLLGDLLGK